jgi:hypothetical protein
MLINVLCAAGELAALGEWNAAVNAEFRASPRPTTADLERTVAAPTQSATGSRDRATIEVRIREVRQIFNSLDPSPFTERDLDDDAEAYIVGWARELDAAGPLRIVVHIPTREANEAQERDLGSAISNYFAYRAGMLERDLRDLFRVGWRSLAIGIAVLAVCIGLSQAGRAALPASTLARLLAEGVMIFGWVANWRPAEILLYDVWAARRRLDLYRRLADAEVELRPY